MTQLFRLFNWSLSTPAPPKKKHLANKLTTGSPFTKPTRVLTEPNHLKFALRLADNNLVLLVFPPPTSPLPRRTRWIKHPEKRSPPPNPGHYSRQIFTLLFSLIDATFFFPCGPQWLTQTVHSWHTQHLLNPSLAITKTVYNNSFTQPTTYLLTRWTSAPTYLQICFPFSLPQSTTLSPPSVPLSLSLSLSLIYPFFLLAPKHRPKNK